MSPTFFFFEIVLTDEWFVVPAGDQKLYKSPFFRDFWHLNVAMMTSNNALVPVDGTLVMPPLRPAKGSGTALPLAPPPLVAPSAVTPPAVPPQAMQPAG